MDDEDTRIHSASCPRGDKPNNEESFAAQEGRRSIYKPERFQKSRIYYLVPVRLRFVPWVVYREFPILYVNPALLWTCSANSEFLQVLTYIDVSATHVGISEDFSFYLVSIANAGSGIGRIGGGILADRFGEPSVLNDSAPFMNYLLTTFFLGAVNVMIPSTLVAAALTYAWPFAKSKGDFIAIGIIYGYFNHCSIFIDSFD